MISLICTTHNSERFISEAIESVINQSYTNWELILWDDGSTDGTAELCQLYAEQDERIKFYPSEHQGRTISLNQAYALTAGEYVGLIDSDDKLEPECLRESILFLQRNRRFGAMYSQHFLMDEAGKNLGISTRTRRPYSKDALLTYCMVWHFRMWQRNLISGIDTTLPYASGHDLALRLSEVTEIGFLEKPLYFYRQHPDQNSVQHRLEQIECSRIAVENAIARRGLNKTLKVEIDAKFTLMDIPDES